MEKYSGSFWIKEFNKYHTCGAEMLSTSSSRASSSMIGRLFTDAMRTNPLKNPIDVIEEMKTDYGVDVTY